VEYFISLHPRAPSSYQGAPGQTRIGKGGSGHLRRFEKIDNLTFQVRLSAMQ
jgi:hypothetical protein